MNYIKKITVLLAFVLSCFNIGAQIGVLTDYPKSIFHVDAANDNPKNNTAAVGAAQQQNDVVIDSNGRLGIGTVSPQSKLHIEHSAAVTGDTYGLRLTPSYGAPAILALGNDGKTVAWEANPSLGQYGKFQITPHAFGYATNPYTDFSKLSGTISLTGTQYITIPSEGRYLFSFDIMGIVTFSNLSYTDPPYQASIYIYLYRKDLAGGTDELLDVIEHYTTILADKDYFNFSTALYAGYCYPSEQLYVVLVPTIGFGSGGTIRPGRDGNFEVTLVNPSMLTVYNI